MISHGKGFIHRQKGESERFWMNTYVKRYEEKINESTITMGEEDSCGGRRKTEQNRGEGSMGGPCDYWGQLFWGLLGQKNLWWGGKKHI